MLIHQDLRLYLCTDRALTLGRPITQAVEAAIAGGVTLVQLREKTASTEEFYRIALAIHALTRPYHLPLVINDRLDIALAVGAEGLHLGQSDLPLSVARRLAGSRMFIGLSASTVEEALRAQAEGADYLGVGPVYPTCSKADSGESIGLEGLAAIRAAVHIPVAAIGGINEANAAQVMEAAVAGIAVISGILSQPDIEAAARNLRRIVDSGR
ncbi:MAG: thiamine phosphate synthase [Treponema sp.]|jgi:thiamine-phosphate pyrophosphorylase|nr:thiamine phosphate synthase [Treponema sp.]